MAWIDTTKWNSRFEERRDGQTGASQHRLRGDDDWLDGSAEEAELQDGTVIDGEARRIDKPK